MNTPHPNCYWVEPDRFLAREYPRNVEDKICSDKLQGIVDAGVGLFVDLTEEGELDPYHAWLKGPQHARLPIQDMSVPTCVKSTYCDSPQTPSHLNFVRNWKAGQ